jgi:GTP cyclohydrolase I
MMSASPTITAATQPHALGTLPRWVADRVTDDPRALRWFDEAGAEDRIARAYQQLLSGYGTEPASILKTTREVDPREVVGVVEVGEIRFFSMCAHHFLPFFGTAKVAYLPGDRILGLGKLPRLVDALARRFSIQEDLTRDIAAVLCDHGGARGARVITDAAHLCMCGRGPSQPTSRTTVEITLGSLAL